MGYRIFDAHADTMSKLYENCGNIKRNNCHIDLERMKNFEGYTQVFAAFADKNAVKETPKEYVKKLIEKYKNETVSCGISLRYRLYARYEIGFRYSSAAQI